MLQRKSSLASRLGAGKSLEIRWKLRACAPNHPPARGRNMPGGYGDENWEVGARSSPLHGRSHPIARGFWTKTWNRKSILTEEQRAPGRVGWARCSRCSAGKPLPEQREGAARLCGRRANVNWVEVIISHIPSAETTSSFGSCPRPRNWRGVGRRLQLSPCRVFSPGRLTKRPGKATLAGEAGWRQRCWPRPGRSGWGGAHSRSRPFPLRPRAQRYGVIHPFWTRGLILC